MDTLFGVSVKLGEVQDDRKLALHGQPIPFMYTQSDTGLPACSWRELGMGGDKVFNEMGGFCPAEAAEFFPVLK